MEGTPERPPTETGKMVVEDWCHLPEIDTFGEEAEVQEILIKDGEKFNIPERFRAKYLKVFLTLSKFYSSNPEALSLFRKISNSASLSKPFLISLKIFSTR